MRISSPPSSLDLLNLENRTCEAMALEFEDMYQQEVQMTIRVEIDAEKMRGVEDGVLIVIPRGARTWIRKN